MYFLILQGFVLSLMWSGSNAVCEDTVGSDKCLRYLSYVLSGSNDCEQALPGWKMFLKSKCLKTCRMCGPEKKEVGPNKCSDEPLKKCSNYAHLCSQESAKEYMETYCPRTCKICKDEPLVDCTDSDETTCQLVKDLGYCVPSSEYFDIARKECPKTCEKCNGSEQKPVTVENCEDDTANQANGNCMEFKNSGFCVPGSMGYTFMLQYCAQTCAFCQPLM